MFNETARIAIASDILLFGASTGMTRETVTGTVKEMEKDMIGITIVTPEGETLTLVADPGPGYPAKGCERP
jgi:hypothetical protein